jgi:hypothetical protein
VHRSQFKFSSIYTASADSLFPILYKERLLLNRQPFRLSSCDYQCRLLWACTVDVSLAESFFALGLVIGKFDLGFNRQLVDLCCCGTGGYPSTLRFGRVLKGPKKIIVGLAVPYT